MQSNLELIRDVIRDLVMRGSLCYRSMGHDVTPESRFEDLNLDSVEKLTLLMEIEMRTGVVLPESDYGDIVTVKDLLDRMPGEPVTRPDPDGRAVP
jgi:acyl carrier protein